MTISTQTRTAGPFTTNGSTTAFPFAFKCFAASDIVVVRRVTATGVESNLVLNTDYTVSLNANQDANPGGTVNTVGALGAGFTLTLTTNLQYLQPTDLTNQGGFYPKVITTALDRLTIFTQQLFGLASRALKFPISDGNLDATIPGKDQRKGKVLAFHETTGLPVAGPTIADTGTVAGIAADIAAVAAIAPKVTIAANNVADITNFSDVYLGPRSTDPTTRTDGSALQKGDLYFNTNNDALRTYTGTRWQEAITGSVAVQRFTGDGTTVSFQMNSSPNNENVVQVFVGGVYQSKTVYDLTGANGDVLTFVSAPPNGVSIEAVTFSVLPLGVVDASQVKMPGGYTLDVFAVFGQTVLLPDFFGAVPGEADSTAKLQAAINALPPFGVLNGGGREYNVKSLLLKSNIELCDIKLKTIAGSTDFVSPITILGETTAVWLDGVATTNYLQGAKSNIKLRRVGINGNRQNQTLIDSPSEDGGRHGIRILGKVTNVLIEECSAEFCGSDGLEIFSGNSKPANENIDSLCFANIVIINSRFNSNRRHGISGDSIFNIKMYGVDCKRNGFDLNTSDPLNHGNRGSRFGGNLYGRPWDFEGYGIGSRIAQLEVIGGDFTGNIAGALIYDYADVNDVNFQTRQDITITGATFDASGATPDACFSIVGTTATTTKQTYDNVNISNCTFKGWLYLKGVSNLNVTGGSAKALYAANTYYAAILNCKKWFFKGVNTDKPNITATPVLPFTPVWGNTIGSPVFSAQDFTLIGFTANGWLCRYKATYTVPATGVSVGTISVSGCRLTPQSISGVVQATGALFQTGLATNGNDLQVLYTTTTTATQNIEAVFEVVPIS